MTGCPENYRSTLSETEAGTAKSGSISGWVWVHGRAYQTLQTHPFETATLRVWVKRHRAEHHRNQSGHWTLINCLG
jgi:hypothetical protein